MAACRVPVVLTSTPLAPLELLENLVPIIGDIADTIEIAAIRAMIEGYAKWFEK